MSITTLVEFDNPANHTFDSSKITVSGGQVKQASQVLPSEILYHNFNGLGVFSTDRGGHSFDLTLNANIGSGKLNLDSNDLSTAIIPSISGITDTFTIQFKLYPNFTTVTEAYMNVLYFRSNVDGSSVRVYLQNQGGGITRVWREVRNAGGFTINNNILGTFDYSVVTVTEFALTFSPTTINSYIDGILVNSFAGVVVDMSDCRIQFGVGITPYSSNYSIDDVALHSAVIINANYTSPSPELYLYSTSASNILTSLQISADALYGFACTRDVDPTLNNVTAQIYKDGKPYYLVGSVWTLSDGTYAQSSSLLDIANNIASFPVTKGIGANFQVSLFLISISGYDTPTVDSYLITYDYGFEGELVGICAVYGQVFDSSGKPVEGATIEVDGKDFLYGNVLVAPKTSTTTDADGSFSISVVETATTNNFVNFKIIYKEGSTKKTFNYSKKIIPNAASAKLSLLATAV